MNTEIRKKSLVFVYNKIVALREELDKYQAIMEFLDLTQDESDNLAFYEMKQKK